MVDAGVLKPWQFKHAPKEKMDRIFQRGGLGQHRTLVDYAQSLAQESVHGKRQTDPTAMMAQAVTLMAKHSE